MQKITVEFQGSDIIVAEELQIKYDFKWIAGKGLVKVYDNMDAFNRDYKVLKIKKDINQRGLQLKINIGKDHKIENIVSTDSWLN
tara:strand:- start:5502 stop:5756 length:255 start_codon:yes stop_codon:yes gene_type:complete